MGVEKMALYILADGQWQCTTAINHGISHHGRKSCPSFYHKRLLHHQQDENIRLFGWKV